MRVLFLVPYFDPAWAYGGIPRVAFGLAHALRDRGHSVTVVTTDVVDRNQRARGGESVEEGVVIHRLRNLSNRLAYDHQLFLPAEALWVVPTEVERADVVHLHGAWHLLGPVGARACARSGRPLVMTPNGTFPPLERKLGAKKVYDGLFGRRTHAAVRRFTAVSDAEVNQLVRGGVERQRIDLVPNGLDLAEFAALPPAGEGRAALGLGDGPVVLYLGKLTPRKGVDHLVGAIARCADPRVQLVIAGNDMGAEATIRRRVEDLGITGRVRWAGLVTGSLRVALLADADLLVYPSSDEIFGLVPFEALLAGTPCVVSDDCGCGEIVRRAKAGDLVRFGDEGGLARAIDALLADEGRRTLLVERGRRYIREHLSWPAIAARTEATYRRAMGEGRGDAEAAP